MKYVLHFAPAANFSFYICRLSVSFKFVYEVHLLFYSTMFENSNHFDLDDDDVLGTSFTPASSSTQRPQVLKRNNEEPISDTSKKLKLTCDQQISSKDPSLPNKSKSIDFTFSSPNRFVKRKFPGPAGLLPERIEGNKSISELIASENSTSNTDSTDGMVFCSQQTVSAFEDGPWKEMTKDFSMCKGEYLYEKFTINWIKKQASLKKLLVNHKAPFLAAVIQSLEVFDGKVPVVNVTLKDATGEIQGTILYSLYIEYSNSFTVGSVLVLKQFGVLSAGYNNHCLTITSNNLLTIYCLEVSKKLPEQDSNENRVNAKKNSVKKVVVQECILEDILKKYDADVLANSEQRQNCINFGKLNQNYRSLSKNNSPENISNSSSYNKFMLPLPSRPNENIFRNNFKRSASENKMTVSNIPLDSFNKGSSHRKFNFKESVKLYHDSSGASTFPDVQAKCTEDQTDRSENKNCDNIIISRSQISVKPDSKEHIDIWKNLLKDVDTESLFDDF